MSYPLIAGRSLARLAVETGQPEVKIIIRAEPILPAQSLPVAGVAEAANRRFGLHVALPIATLALAASLLLLGAVWWAAREQDRYSVTASRQVLRGAIDNRREFLADEVAEDAIWSEAFQELHETASPVAIGANMIARINGSAGVDASMVVGPDDNVVYTTRSGASAPTTMGAGIPRALQGLVASERTNRSDAPVTRLVVFGGEPAIASAAVIRGLQAPPGEPRQASLLVFVDLLDQRLLAQFARDFGLANLHWQTPGEPHSETSLTLKPGSEPALGTLSWSVELPGTAMLRQTAPALTAVILCFGLLTAVVLVRARTTAILLQVAQAQATHDPLTGLPNRLLLTDRLDQALTKCRREPGQVALLYVDLDGFKAVNDRFGHAHGDAVLIEAARRLRRTARETDTVARLSGDEFAVVQTVGEQPGAALALCRRLLQALAKPMQVGNRTVRVGASIGVAVGPDDAGEPAILLRLADQALYRAKGCGRGTFRLFEREGEKTEPGGAAPSPAVL